MRALRETIAFTAAMAVFVTSAAVAQPSAPIAVGQVVQDAPGSHEGDWTFVMGATYAPVTTAAPTSCCVVVWARRDTYTVARTERTSQGGVSVERVLATKVITKGASEEEVDCDSSWLHPAFSLEDRRTRLVRSVVIVDNSLAMITWRDDDRRCDRDQD